MQRKNKKTPAALSNKLDWNNFNLLENLLIFCTVPDLNAPTESGVKFRINSPASDDVVCILFKIDRGGSDPLIRGEEIKPDYMAFYADKNTCVCSIIEMKGTTEAELKHGIDQIKKWRDILHREIQVHFPNKFRTRIKFQGILLSPPNSNIPLVKIKKELSNGFVILPLQYKQKAELLKYVSKVHKNIEINTVEPSPHDANHGFIEDLITNKALDKRIIDNFFSQNFKPSKKRIGVYVNYRASTSDYAALFFNTTTTMIGFKEKERHLSGRVKKALSSMGVQNQKIVRYEYID